MLALLAVLSLIVSSVALVAPALVSADGDGSPAECLTAYSATGGDDEMTYTAPSGFIVTGVCIKSGANMFGDNKHSDVLGNGTYENGCYEVSGVAGGSASEPAICEIEPGNVPAPPDGERFIFTPACASVSAVAAGDWLDGSSLGTIRFDCTGSG